MDLSVYASSIILALVPLTALAWKWRVKMSTAVIAALIIGVLAGLAASRVHAAFTGLDTASLIIIELAIIGLLTVLAIAARFYRDPDRSPQETDGVIIAPADGKIIYVNRVEKGSSLVATKGRRQFKLDEITATELPAHAAYLIGIEMNILNVHVNRSPIEGKVVLSRRTRGRFMSLRKPEAEAANARVTTVIGNGDFEIGVVQISSRLVRKIVSYVREGDVLAAGQRLGAILFGSQVDVVVPELEDLKIEVATGDEVRAGISVMARYNVPAGSGDIKELAGKAVSGNG